MWEICKSGSVRGIEVSHMVEYCGTLDTERQEKQRKQIKPKMRKYNMSTRQTYQAALKSGITRTKEFEKKGLAQYSVNVGTRCGHQCLYCSTPSLLRMHSSFKQAGENPFTNGYAIVDPQTPERVAIDARKIKNRGMVQLCTTVDAWAPEAKELDLGRKCMEAILSEPDWTVRILTKNAAVLEDFNLIEKYKDRVLIGMSITAAQDKSNIISIIEPYASSIIPLPIVKARNRHF